MSFLNSVISSIGGEGKPQASPATSTSRPSSTVVSRTGTPTITKAQPADSGGTLKRKAEDGRDSGQSKLARTIPGNSLVPPLSRSATTSPAPRAGAPPPKTSAYQGTMKSKTSSPAPASVSKPIVQPSKVPPAAAKPPTASSSTVSVKPAVKGGYLATLERAKAAQEAAKQIGLIKHQKVERLSRKEKERLQAEAAAKAKQGKAGQGKPLKGGERSRDATPLAGKPGMPTKDKKPVEVGYKGTMRPVPAQPSYKGTMHSGKAATSNGAYGGRTGNKQDGYAAWSDEDEEEVEEEDDYDSGSSDMEARIDEIDEEELRSARVAKKEDEEALRLENEQKRIKLERKKKLEQLQAAAANKRKLY